MKPIARMTLILALGLGALIVTPIAKAGFVVSHAPAVNPRSLSENISASHPEPVEGWLAPAQSRTLRRAQDASLGFRIGTKLQPASPDRIDQGSNARPDRTLYAKFEIAFDITGTAATNMYFPYDLDTPTGIEPGTGINVDAYLLPPNQADWTNGENSAVFLLSTGAGTWYGSEAGLVPTGSPEWRCRFTPETAGTWQYKVRAQDAAGTAESAIQQFSVIDSSRKGFVRISATDPRFFEFSDGTPFVAPLINVEEGNPFQ